MEEAQAAGDFDAYFEARTLVEATKRAGWVEDEVKSRTVVTTIDVNDVQEAVNAHGAQKLGEELQFANSDTVYIAGLGDVVVYDSQFGYEGGPSEMWVVFSNGNQFWRMYGRYDSWGSDDWYGEVEEVTVSKDIRTKIENNYKVVR